MDTQQFIASLVSSLAWPAAVVAIALLFRKQIVQLLTGPVRRLKAGPVEFEFERIISTVETQVDSPPPSDTRRSASDGSAITDLEATAHTSPMAAVMEAYGRLERQLHDLLQSAGDEMTKEGRSAMMLARRAAELELITPETLNALQGLTVLRNLAAHGRGDEISVERAVDYLSLVDAVSYAIKQDRRK